MANFQYKIGAGGTWTDVPDLSHPVDDSGSVTLDFPKPTDQDGNGLPAGIPYRKRVVLKTAQMYLGVKGTGAAGQGTGMQFYQNFFASEDAATAASFYVTALNPRTGVWEKYLGTILRPTWESIAYTGATLVYNNVLITVDDVAHAT
jgi:hypothetical protein